MDLDELLSPRDRLDQTYLCQTLIRCKQLRLGLYYVFEERFFEKDDEIQNVLNAIEQSDVLSREKSTCMGEVHDYNRIFPKGDKRAYGLTPGLRLNRNTVNTSLGKLLKVNIEILEKLNKKRKNVLKKQEKLKNVAQASELTSDKQQKFMKKLAREFFKDLDKYSAYQEQDLILQTLIMEKLLRKSEKISHYHQSLLSTKIERLSKLVYALTGTKPSSYYKTIQPDSEFWISDSWSLLSMQEDVEEPDQGDLLASAMGDVEESLEERNIYLKVVKPYTSRGPDYLDLSLKAGQIVKEKYGVNNEGMCYGWTRSFRFSPKRYGFYPVDCVLPVETKVPELRTWKTKESLVADSSSKLLTHFFAKLSNTFSAKIPNKAKLSAKVSTKAKLSAKVSTKAKLSAKVSTDESTGDSAYGSESATHSELAGRSIHLCGIARD